ncbi:L-threonylcarbamoyladenylate synthase [Natronoflexus pectinivorans]|uniref:L-threonylcarbamoyladenylate synthase n=1 Tax=Natronoflexus pectinivorans TaxID=682526 RepID=A0A4R2GRU6_9BACT|nr:L-threonylcarbamoyladenylate synthase [Natronoflexus pectinivorans]TCO10886.1 L-threonylcarbamoyladenylate synthase [Natronoflexus pectinivorans]
MTVSERYDNEDFKQALTVLKQGGIILYPTDTVWGIGCDATNDEAVNRIIRLKQRVSGKGMISLIDQPGLLNIYLDRIPDMAYDLWEIAEKPLTLIIPGAKKLAKEVMTSDGSMAVRITKEIFSKTLCQRLKRPLVSTSANISGEPTPRDYTQIDDRIVKGVDYVVEYRRDDVTPETPSGIIKLGVNYEIEVIRK